MRIAFCSWNFDQCTAHSAQQEMDHRYNIVLHVYAGFYSLQCVNACIDGQYGVNHSGLENVVCDQAKSAERLHSLKSIWRKTGGCHHETWRIDGDVWQ